MDSFYATALGLLVASTVFLAPLPSSLHSSKRLFLVAVLSAPLLYLTYPSAPAMTTPATAWPKPSAMGQQSTGPPRSWHGKITTDGDGDSNGLHPPETDRYHLYIGLFCPFAHRANLVRHIKGLQNILPITIVKPFPKGDADGWPGWAFPATHDEYAGATPDPLFNAAYLHEIYFRADPAYTGRYSVPVLWDKTLATIVNTESSEIMRDLQTAFNGMLPADKAAITLYPAHLRAEIDRASAWMQSELNTGVYKAGFAATQEAYDDAVPRVFAALNRLEKTIAAHGGPYILGADLTELDVLAYVSLVRFDIVYVQLFKCNLGTIRHDYPQVNNWLKHLYWHEPGFRETTDFRHIRENYNKSLRNLNPQGITPLGPWPDVEEGYEADWSQVRVGGVQMPRVLEIEATYDKL